MQFSFDGFDRYEIPTLTLANPNFEELHVIKNPKDLKASIRFNAISELSFYVDKTNSTKYYFDYLTKKRLIHVNGFGWFIILNTEMTSTGKTPRKQVNCVSYEAFLSSKLVNLDAGTYVFYNPASPTDTLLYKLFGGSYTWKIGYVSPSLYGKARTFDMPDTSIYSFLTSDVAEAYECVFIFDNEERTVNAYTVDELVKDSGVMIRFDTIMKEVTINETTDEIITALSVYGSSDFSINNVNPLGTPTIYIFDHCKDMMTPDLWEAIQEWQAKIDAQTETYATILSELKQKNSDLLFVKSDLAKMEMVLDSGKQVRDVQTPYTLQSSSNTAMTSINAWIESETISTLKSLIVNAIAYPAISFTTPPSAIATYVSNVATADKGIGEALANIWACERLMVAQNAEIYDMNAEINSLRGDMSAINNALSFTNNFTPAQLEELEKYIVGTDFTNEYCVITSSMTYPEIQDVAMDLLAQGKRALERISQPTYEFDLDAVNYLFNKKYEGFINQTKLGYSVHAEITEDKWVTPILLEINLNWSQPDDFSMKFGNRFRLQTSEYIWADLAEESSKVSSAVSSEFSKLVAPSRNGTMDEVSALLNNAWDAAKNAVIAGDNQAMVMDRHGLIGRKALLDVNGNVTGFFDPEQFRMINNMLCFTDDNWQNVKTAIGKIKLADGTTAYGVSAEVLMGILVAGNNCIFTNESGSFLFDGNGATLTNATLTISSADSLSQILINATDGFKIRTRSSDTQSFEDRFYIDTEGNLIMSGVLNAKAGKIGDWLLDDGKLVNVNKTVGMISTTGSNVAFYAGGTNPGTAPFRVLANGTLFANNATISGQVNASGGIFQNVDIASGSIGGMSINGNGFSYGGLQIIDRNGNFELPGLRIIGDAYAPNIIGKGETLFIGTTTHGSAIAIQGRSNTLSFGAGFSYTEINSDLRLYNLQNRSGATHLGIYNNTVVATDSGSSSSLNNIYDYSGGVRVDGQIWASLQSGSFIYNVGYGYDSQRLVYGSSSIRYKEDIEAIAEDAADRLMDLTPILYNYKDDPERRKTPNIGLIAEDVAEHYPELVGFKFTNDNRAIPETVRYDLLSVALLKYVQKLNKRMKELERRFL